MGAEQHREPHMGSARTFEPGLQIVRVICPDLAPYFFRLALGCPRRLCRPAACCDEYEGSFRRIDATRILRPFAIVLGAFASYVLVRAELPDGVPGRHKRVTGFGRDCPVPAGKLDSFASPEPDSGDPVGCCENKPAGERSVA